MKPEEAIEVLELALPDFMYYIDSRLVPAYNLSIEALKFFKDIREGSNPDPHYLLPGETEE